LPVLSLPMLPTKLCAWVSPEVEEVDEDDEDDELVSGGWLVLGFCVLLGLWLVGSWVLGVCVLLGLCELLGLVADGD